MEQCCRVCGDSHNETVKLIWEAEISRIPATELLGELAYVERELSCEPMPERRGPLLHRKGFLLREQGRRGLRAQRDARNNLRERIDRAKDSCDLEALINLPIARMNINRTWMHCDAHGTDSTASLVIYNDAGRWWCYGCNSGGDAIDWMIARRNVGFMEALEALERFRGIEYRKKAVYE